ncbi:penicillin amidase [Nitrosomonas sp. Nm51]|uniref:penicillin acylase family protein n=1 Tax=Nitrosomonas sp. Nm51 TaxID=133720 RepID=UPI0008CFA2D0|nr:penicillin acylase family protein [Nitrosomonas sp. Nm51]SER52331.1 penicillin amidase [Nitrosomonas sp. Nm51]
MRRFSKILRYVAAALAGCSVLSVLSVWLLIFGSLPQYEGKAHFSALSAAVTVERDALGSVTITGQDRHDIAGALGYVHAQERFFEMDLMRRQAAGELADIFGKAALPLDMEIRQYRMRARAREFLEQLPRDQRALLKAYRAGVNKGLEALAVRPYPYLLTRTQPVQWVEEDSLLVIFSMFVTLNDPNSRRELGLSYLHAELPDALYRFLTAGGGSWDTPLTGDPLEWPSIPSADDFNLREKDAPLLTTMVAFDESIPGSNNFAVAGNLAAMTDGAALVANDMHLTLRVPNLWFRTRLIAREKPAYDSHYSVDVTGITLPGVPAVVIGSNRHIAWSFTNSYGDFIDWVRIMRDPEDTSRYLGTSGWQSIRSYQETIHIRNAPAKEITVHETEWGPIVARDHDGVPLAMAWTALQPGAINLDLIKLENAQHVDDAAEIAQQTGMPPQNFIVGDRHGNILWTIAGRIPVRTGGFDPLLPADWSKPETGWQGWLHPADYPLIRNPESGRLWTANTRTVAVEQLPILGDGGYDLGARSRQIRDSIFARDRFFADDLFTIQLDHRAILYIRWHALLMETLNHAENTALHTQVEDILKNWDGQAAVDSVAYRIVRGFRQEVIKTLLNAYTAEIKQRHPAFQLPRLNQIEHAVWRLIEQRPPHHLPQPYDDWHALIFSCLQQVIAGLHQQSGDISARTWGEKNAAHIRHPLSQHLPEWIAGWLDMPNDPLPGDMHMPRIQTPTFGASQRSVVAPGQEEAGYFDMPGGQSGHPLSPYYGSGHASWVSNEPAPFMPGKAEKTLYLVP